jgi:predicted permease
VSLKNVLRLYGVYSKSSRLIAKGKFRRYKDKWWLNYAAYAVLLLFGAGFGALIALGISAIGGDQAPIQAGAASIFVSLPVLAILYSLYFTQMSQIQRMGANTMVQPIYWFPLTWEEHTLASILTSMSAPMAITLLLVPVILIPSFTIGMLPLGMLTIVALVAGMAMSGATAEILKGVQSRVVGALSKRAGRLTVWARFVVTLGIFTLVYVFYFAINRADIMSLVQSLASGIMIAWFIPYLWPGIVLYEAYHGSWPEAIAFTAASASFVWILYRLAVRSSAKYALKDTSAIRISGGSYVPKQGILQRTGISQPVAAIMRKDLRAYTRRPELMYVFLMPIVFVVSTLMPVMAGRTGPDTFSFFYLALEPPVVLAVFLASSIVGSEGDRRWYLFMSPLSPRSFVRAKYLFCTLISIVVALVAAAIAILLFSPTLYMIATGIVEALLLTFSIGMVALSFGIRGADFREAPRQRTVQPIWMMMCMIASVALTLIVVLPVLAYGAADMFSGLIPGLLPSPMPHAYLFAAWVISGVLALAIGSIFYVISVRFAGDLFKSMDA